MDAVKVSDVYEDALELRALIQTLMVASYEAPKGGLSENEEGQMIDTVAISRMALRSVNKIIDKLSVLETNEILRERSDI